MPSDATAELGFYWPVLGHSHIKQYLQSCLAKQTLTHAYLFSGPASVGKYLMATHLAASILCQSPDQKKPCQTCPACLQLSKNIHPDVDCITRDPEKKNISIEQIRKLQHKLSLSSFLTSYKIAIIDDAETMNEEAANALLKTLEEPTPQTIIILVAEHTDWLPATIRSRCQLIQFNLVPSFQIENWLIMKGVDKKEALAITHFAGGRPGQAMIAMSDHTLRERRVQSMATLTDLINGTINDRFFIINQLVAKKTTNEDYHQLLKEWLGYYRDIILYKNDLSTLIGPDAKQAASTTSKKYSIDQLRQICQSIGQGIVHINQSVNPRLVLENISLLL